MAHTLIRHKVQDFPSWKRVFDEASEKRAAVGETEWHVYHDWNDPAQVTVLTRFNDLEHAQRWLQSQEFREKIKEAGVIGDPEIHFLAEVG